MKHRSRYATILTLTLTAAGACDPPDEPGPGFDTVASAGGTTSSDGPGVESDRDDPETSRETEGSLPDGAGPSGGDDPVGGDDDGDDGGSSDGDDGGSSGGGSSDVGDDDGGDGPPSPDAARGCGRPSGAAIFEADFEGGGFGEVDSVHADGGTVVEVVDNPDGDGRVVQFSITPAHERAEIRVRRVPLGSYYYDWLMYVPEDWEPAQGKSDILTQWHRGGGLPDWARGNPMVLHVSDDGDYGLTWSYLENNQNTGTRVNESGSFPRNANDDRGRWVRWGLEARWSTGDDGVLRVYHDCALIFEHLGPNWLPQVASPMWKAGIYTGNPGWTGPATYTVFEDEFTIYAE